MVFRVRRKKTGYIWMECTGRLHVDAGKGRKTIIMAGRQRVVPSISWGAIAASGGVTPREFWAKLSIDGMILWALGFTKDVGGRSSDDLLGRSFYSLLPNGVAVAPSSDGNPAALQVEKALLAAAEGHPKNSSNSVKHQLVRPDGSIVNVVSVFYVTAPMGSETISPLEEDAFSPSSSESDAPTPAPIAPLRSSEILVQIKLAGQQNKPLLHPSSEDVYEEMDTTRGTSWQYELHQLRIANRKLKEEIESARTGKPMASSRKRKAEDDGNGIGGGPTPKADFATPLHQQTPGFGLAPAALYGSWQ